MQFVARKKRSGFQEFRSPDFISFHPGYVAAEVQAVVARKKRSGFREFRSPDFISFHPGYVAAEVQGGGSPEEAKRILGIPALHFFHPSYVIDSAAMAVDERKRKEK